MTMALAGMPKSPLLSSGRPSMAVASLGQAGPAAGFASQFVTKGEDNGELPQTVVSPQWLNNALSNSNIKVEILSAAAGVYLFSYLEEFLDA